MFYCSLQLSLKVLFPVKFSIICKIVIKICKILVLNLLYLKGYSPMSSLPFWWYLLLEQWKSGIEKTVSACIFPAWVVYSLYSIHTFHVLTRQPTWVLISSYTAPGRLCGHPSSTTWHEFNSHHGLTALLFALQKHHQVPGRAGTPGHRRGRRTPSSVENAIRCEGINRLGPTSTPFPWVWGFHLSKGQRVQPFPKLCCGCVCSLLLKLFSDLAQGSRQLVPTPSHGWCLDQGCSLVSVFFCSCVHFCMHSGLDVLPFFIWNCW